MKPTILDYLIKPHISVKSQPGQMNNMQNYRVGYKIDAAAIA
jgi:hypothetical protein